MGMDVYGRKARSEVGEYFRANVWSWPELWDYCREVAPELTAKVPLAYSNDGDGLDDDDSRALAAKLLTELAAGRTAKYAGDRAKRLAEMPSIPCTICAGTGKRLPPPACGAGDQACNGCRGLGKVRPSECHYVFDVDRVERWAAFLAECGGFEIR